MPKHRRSQRKAAQPRRHSPTAAQAVSQAVEPREEPPKPAQATARAEQQVQVTKPHGLAGWLQSWLPVILNFMLLVVFIFQSYVFKQQWEAMNRQSDFIAKQLEITNMGAIPYVWASDYRLTDFAAGQRPTVEVWFENGGQTPAVGAVFELKLEVRDTPLPEELDFPAEAGDASKEYLPAHAKTSQLLTKKQPLTGEQINAIKDGRLTFYVYGRVRFRDKLGRRYLTKYCAYYMKDMPRLTTCSQHNDPRDEAGN